MAAARRTRCSASPRLIASLHDADGRVARRRLSRRHRCRRTRPCVDAIRRRRLRLPTPTSPRSAPRGPAWADGRGGLLERQWLEPTLELNGMWGGYPGPGTKTVIPAPAHAKITCRLVPGQEPAAVVRRSRLICARRCPAGFALEIAGGAEHATRAYAIDPANPGARCGRGRPARSSTASRPFRVAMGATLAGRRDVPATARAGHRLLQLRHRGRGLSRAERVLPPRAVSRRPDSLGRAPEPGSAARKLPPGLSRARKTAPRQCAKRAGEH